MFGNNKTHMHRHLFAVTYHAVIKLSHVHVMFGRWHADDGTRGHCLCINL